MMKKIILSLLMLAAGNIAVGEDVDFFKNSFFKGIVQNIANVAHEQWKQDGNVTTRFKATNSNKAPSAFAELPALDFESYQEAKMLANVIEVNNPEVKTLISFMYVSNQAMDQGFVPDAEIMIVEGELTTSREGVSFIELDSEFEKMDHLAKSGKVIPIHDIAKLTNSEISSRWQKNNIEGATTEVKQSVAALTSFDKGTQNAESVEKSLVKGVAEIKNDWLARNYGGWNPINKKTGEQSQKAYDISQEYLRNDGKLSLISQSDMVDLVADLREDLQKPDSDTAKAASNLFKTTENLSNIQLITILVNEYNKDRMRLVSAIKMIAESVETLKKSPGMSISKLNNALGGALRFNEKNGTKWIKNYIEKIKEIKLIK